MKNLTFTLVLLVITQLAFGQSLSVPRTQRSMVTKLSATWCPICGLTAWDVYDRMVVDNAKNALVVSMHRSTSSRLYSATATEILSNFETAVSQPWFYVNDKRIGQGSTATENTVKTEVNKLALNTPLAQVGLNANFRPATNELVVNAKAEFFQAGNGEYYLGFYLIEKEVIEEQENRSDKAVHKNVLRTSLTTSAYGTLLSSAASIAAGATFDQSIKFLLAPTYKTSNLTIAAVLWRRNGAKFEFVNLNTDEQVESVTTSVQDLALASSLQIQPNPVGEAAQIALELPQAVALAEVALFNALGQEVATLYRGGLAAGKHQLNWQRPHQLPVGWYTLRVVAAGRFAAKSVWLAD